MEKERQADKKTMMDQLREKEREAKKIVEEKLMMEELR